jgi:hypothetical protein
MNANEGASPPATVDWSVVLESRPFLAGLIAANKYSVAPDSLYRLRRGVIAEADKRGLAIVVGGAGWGLPTARRLELVARSTVKCLSGGVPPAVRSQTHHLSIRPRHCLGPVADQVLVYGEARAALVIENSPDYISEKLVDALLHGVPPVYIGANLAEFGFPPDIALTPDANPEEIVDTIAQMSTAKAGSVVQAGQAWLRSPSAEGMSTARVFAQVAQHTVSYLER